MSSEVNIEELSEKLIAYFESGEIDNVKAILESMDISYIPDLLKRLDPQFRPLIAHFLSNESISKFIDKLEDEILLDFVKGIPPSRLVRIASELPADELADLLIKLPPSTKRLLYRELPYWKIEEVKPLLEYPPETAGGLMTNQIPIFHKDRKVGEALEEFTLTLKFHRYDTSNYLYVVDGKGDFLGWAKVTEAITVPRNKTLNEVIKKPPTVLPDTDQEEVAKLVARYDLEEIPVVDKKGRLLGAITSDDIIDVIISEASEDIIKFGGTVELEHSYLVAKISDLIKSRAIWIILLYILESLTANVLKFFEGELTKVVALSFFIPLLIDSGGNVGSQSATLVIRALALGELTTKDFIKVLFRESLTALGLGALLSPIAFGIAYTVSWDVRISVVVALSIIAVVFLSSLTGGFLPFLARALKLDPAIISAPLITTLSDILGLTLYFVLAMLVLGL